MMASLKRQKKTADNFDNLKKMIPKLGNTTYNQKMSINVYLNHHCKDAINIQDFLNKSSRRFKIQKVRIERY